MSAETWLDEKKMPLSFTLDAIQRHAKEHGAQQEDGYWYAVIEGFELCYKPGFWMASYISWPSPAFNNGKPNLFIALQVSVGMYAAIFSADTVKEYPGILTEFEAMLTKLFDLYHGGVW